MFQCQLVYQKVSYHTKTRVHEVTLCVHFITLSSLPHCLYVLSFQLGSKLGSAGQSRVFLSRIKFQCMHHRVLLHVRVLKYNLTKNNFLKFSLKKLSITAESYLAFLAFIGLDPSSHIIQHSKHRSQIRTAQLVCIRAFVLQNFI